MKIIKKYKQIIVFVIFTLIFILSGIFYAIPSIISINNAQHEIEEISLKNRVLIQKIQTLNSLSKDILSERYAFVNGALLQTKNPYQVFNSFDKILNKINSKDVSLGEIKFSSGEIKKNSDLKVNDNLMFKTSISGNFDTVLDFIEKLENDYPLMTLKSIDGKLKEDRQVNFELNITLFVYPEIAFIPSLETPIAGFLQSENLFFQNLVSTSSGILKEEILPPVKSVREDPFR